MKYRVLALLVAVMGWLTTAAQAALPQWNYHITETHRGGLLYVSATLQRPHTLNLSVDDGAEPYVRYVQIYHGHRWVPIRPQGNFWILPVYARAGATIRYQYDIASAARHVNRMGLAQKNGPVYHVCPEAFLLRPCDDSEARVFFHVASTDKTKFLTGYQQVGTSTWTSLATDLSLGPDATFGPLKEQIIRSHGAVITLAYRGLPLSDHVLQHWMAHQSNLVGSYFDGFPVRRLLVVLLPVPGTATEGHARGGSGASVCITVGRDVTAADLLADTVYVHELVHVCTPALKSRWHWMEEGIATYLERIIPAQAGDVSPETVWLGLVDDLPRGLPQAGDQGLNRTEDENRTYFGGALYWLLADIQIQTRSHGHHSLRDVMRAFHKNGASITHLWDIQRLFALSHQSTGLGVLHRLYIDMADAPYKPDLPRLWKELGVRREGAKVTMGEAPMSAIRVSLTPDQPATSNPYLASVVSDWIVGTLDFIGFQLPTD